MAALGDFLFVTVTTAAPVTVEVGIDNPRDPIKTRYAVTKYQFNASGAGSLKIEVKIQGEAAFSIAVAALANAPVTLDLVAVDEFKLTATTANVPVSIAPIAAAR